MDSSQNIHELFVPPWAANTVYFWDSLESGLSEIRRVLKPSGIFFNTMLSSKTLDRFPHTKHGYKKFTSDELVKAGSEAGFDVEVVPIFNGYAFCYIYRKKE